MSDPANDPFGLTAAAEAARTMKDEPGADTPAIDLDRFRREKPINPERVLAARAVSEERGFHRTSRGAPDAPAQPRPEDPPAPRESRPRGRVRIGDLTPEADPRDQEQRVQLNMLVPVSVGLRWKQLTQAGEKQWKMLDRAIELLEAEQAATDPTSKRG